MHAADTHTAIRVPNRRTLPGMHEQGYPEQETRPASESLYKDEQMEVFDGLPEEGEVSGMTESTNRLLDYEKLRIIGIRAQQIRQVFQSLSAPHTADLER